MPKTAKTIESMNAGILVNEIFTMDTEIGNTNIENTDTDTDTKNKDIGKSLDGISHIKEVEDMEDVEVEDVEDVEVMTVINVQDLAEKHV